MKGAILATKPYTDFPSGGMTFCAHASKVLDAPILAQSKNLITEVGAMQIADRLISSLNFTPDYVLFGVGANLQSGDMPKIESTEVPVVSMIHDIWYIYQNKDFIFNISDGFIVSMDETADEIRKFRQNAKIIRFPLPYVHQGYEFDLAEKKNAIISTGRIVPEKGHRHPAQLAELGYEVWIVGQRVDHHEYQLYYDRVERSGAKMFPNPTSDGLRELLQQAKVFMGFTYTVEQHCQPEYSLLEAINYGCFPMIANWMRKYTDESGLLFDTVECAADAVPRVKRIFSNGKLYSIVAQHNLEILEHWSDDYREKFEDFVRGL